MKLVVERLGPVQGAAIEIRPLTVFVGPNNTGKTWAAYALYGLLRPLSPTIRARRGPSPTTAERTPAEAAIRQATERVLQLHASTGPESDVQVEFGRSELYGDIQGPVRYSLSEGALREVLRLSEKHLVGARASLDLEPGEFVDSGNSKLRLTLRKRQKSLSAEIFTTEDKELDSMTFAVSNGDWKKEVDERLRLFAAPLENRTLAFPALRKALVSMYKLLQPESARVLTLPVVDFVEFLRNAELTAQLPPRASLPSAADAMEKVLGGRIDYTPAEPGLDLAYIKEGLPPFPMHSTSSVVRSLAALDLYVRRFAMPGDRIILDEPEMNAHPALQLALTELLALLVQKGVRVVLTTHSPYVIDHINNLMEAARLPEGAREEVAPLFRLGTAEAFIPKEKVAAYEFHDDGRVTSLWGDDGRDLEWATFSRETDYVANLYGQLLARSRHGERDAD